MRQEGTGHVGTRDVGLGREVPRCSVTDSRCVEMWDGAGARGLRPSGSVGLVWTWVGRDRCGKSVWSGEMLLADADERWLVGGVRLDKTRHVVVAWGARDVPGRVVSSAWLGTVRLGRTRMRVGKSVRPESEVGASGSGQSGRPGRRSGGTESQAGRAWTGGETAELGCFGQSVGEVMGGVVSFRPVG